MTIARCLHRGCALPAGHSIRHTDGSMPSGNLRGRHRVHSSSARDNWETPPDLFARLDAEFHFQVDVAASDSNALCPLYFTKADDALSRAWMGTCWMNPPYGREIRAWMAKALDASRSGLALVVALVPARTDTRWWHESAELASERRFIQGRLRFRIDGKVFVDPRPGRREGMGSPFPSAIVIFRP